jgi:UDP-N-acetylmuramoyl-tripeptide--D-alanyl-D-alanine ligase
VGRAGMMLLSQAAQALGARMVGAEAEFASVSTDSRKIEPGCLFIALRGEHFDGARFVEAAARDGATAAMINADSYDGHAACPLLLVDDTRLALGRLAAHWRGGFDIPVVGLTGSNGKTTVKEMLASILGAHAGSADAVLATQGNLNNDIGMPLTLLRMRPAHRYAVIEMGMNHAGEIDYLTRIARPQIALVNNASGAHLAGLGTVENVARAKGEIFAGLGNDGIAVINADDPHAALWRKLAHPHRVIAFALDAEADVSACWDVTEFGIQMELATPDGDAVVHLRVPGAHNARNALAAAAAAVALGVPLPVIASGLEKFGGVAGRLQRKQGRNGAIVIDDTYNANPDSVRAALKVLAQLRDRRIFVLGDMGELGPDAPRLHAEIGAEARRLGVAKLLGLGELSREAVQAFGEGARHFEDVEELNRALAEELAPGVTVLVKGSRFMKMERVVGSCTEGEETCCSH